MTAHFADRLLDAIARKGSPVCVGIDPNPARLPEEFRSDDPAEQLALVSRWCGELLEVVAPFVPAVKPQIAYFEALGGAEPFAGLAAYSETVARAQELGLLVIGDAKRGDIGSTATAYATAHLRNAPAADALTINAYFGRDGLSPFLAAAAETGRGLFALVRTSNPTGADIQNVATAEGAMFYEHMARQIDAIGSAAEYEGESGFSCLGAVVGATCPDEARTLRNLMPKQLFLVPGYGAQGATAADCAASFTAEGTGAIVNAARSVIYAHSRDKYAHLADWKQAVAAAAEDFARDIASAVLPG
jgi:orotidine-5'-phosphate decarboxylase